MSSSTSRRSVRLISWVMLLSLWFGMLSATVPASASPTTVAKPSDHDRTQVSSITLDASITQTSAYAGDKSLTLTLEARTSSGSLDTSYRGEIDINPSAAVLSLYQSPVQGAPDDVFTAADAGRKVITNWGFAVTGNQSR